MSMFREESVVSENVSFIPSFAVDVVEEDVDLTSVSLPRRSSEDSSSLKKESLKEVPSENGVDHPEYYGGEDNPYEVIKVIEAWGLGFKLGNAIKYIGRAGKKDSKTLIKDLKKAVFYLNRKIDELSGEL